MVKISPLPSSSLLVPLVLADAARLAELGGFLFTHAFGALYPKEDLEAFLARHYTISAAQEELQHPAARAWGVEQGGWLHSYVKVGSCKLPLAEGLSQCAPEERFEIHRLYIHPDYQGLGLGRQLMRRALEYAKEAGYREAYLGVWSQNHRAQALYHSCGFEQVGDYWFEVGKQRDYELIMRRFV